MYELADKMAAYCGWSKEGASYKHTIDVMMVFLECLQDQVKQEEGIKCMMTYRNLKFKVRFFFFSR